MARILLADDAPDIRLLLRTLFSVQPNMDVVGEAECPREAVRLAGELSPDVVVMDHGFRGDLSGLESASSVKEAAPGVKVILFTAYQDLEKLAESNPAVDAFVLKNDLSQLVELAKEMGN